MNLNQALHARARIGAPHALGMITCTLCATCAREHPEDARTCLTCGTPLTLATCAACEAINAIEAARCHQCGIEFAQHATVDTDEYIADDEASDTLDAGPTFVIDPIEPAVKASPDADDDFIALAEERRYIGPDGGKHALADATPIAFADRVANDLPASNGFPTSDVVRAAGKSRGRSRSRRAHLGVAGALVLATGVAAYFAFDVPALRAIVANAIVRANAIAPLVSSTQEARTGERVDDATTAVPSVPDAAPSTPAMPMQPASADAAPTQEAAPDADRVTTADAAAEPPAAATPAQAAPTPVSRARSADRQHRITPRAHASVPRRTVDRDALETQRLIDRDLGRFLAK